jgi:Fe-S-cluster containining protein
MSHMQDVGTTAGDASVDAGPFRLWLDQMRASLRGDAGTDVPCGDCVGCCVSSYYIPVRPQDEAARARVPANLLVDAPGMPPGHKMMGYYADGTCPMLSDRKCSIYHHRPQTCRDYDCRIFAAAGIEPGGPDKAVINQRVNAWRFAYPTEADRRAHAAVRAAADFIRARKSSFPGGRAPDAPTGIAVLAVKAYPIFMDTAGQVGEDADVAKAIIEASREFDAGRSS